MTTGGPRRPAAPGADGAPPRRVGVVLAGGESRRYGRPKWRETVGGVSMAARALAAMAPHVSATLVVGSDPGLADLGAPVRPDARPGRGPLGGLETALLYARESGATHALVLACDLPLVDASTMEALLRSVGPADHAVVPRTSSAPQPLAAAWGVAALPTVQDLLDGSGEPSLRRLLDRVPVRWVEAAALPGGEVAFTNVNHARERDRAERLLRGTSGA